jgi:hypothetical protein
MADQRDPDRHNAGKTLSNGLAVATAFGIFRHMLVVAKVTMFLLLEPLEPLVVPYAARHVLHPPRQH